MNDGHLLVAYHGCDITVRDAVVSGQLTLKPSANDYDWLGSGVYAFEGDPARAMVFAETAAREPQRRLTKQPIATPAVLGALLCVRRCLDVTTRVGLEQFAAAYDALGEAWVTAGVPEDRRPVNSPAAAEDADVIVRKLDNAVFQLLHAMVEGRGDAPYQVVRGAFRQGPELAPRSGLHRDSHVQLAVRDMTCVVGWFLPPGDRLMSGPEAEAAAGRYNAARHAYQASKTRIHRASETH
ncbi:hypothetical protein [Rhodanobacter sp. FW106-PBR-R2A-1-13]|uniref:hypothetical protein n=1 Tax=Rhodanobacter sp. FW106-PBR-R2A-1-13 TaxID=3454845 RepID=UPI0034E4642C